MTTEFIQLKEHIEKAKLGSFLIIPLKYDHSTFSAAWLAENATLSPFETMDINESVKQAFNSPDRTNVISRYKITQETFLHEILGENTDANEDVKITTDKNTEISFFI